MENEQGRCTGAGGHPVSVFLLDSCRRRTPRKDGRTMHPTDPTGDMSVIGKAVRILEAFSIKRPRLSLTELSQLTGMSPSTTLRRAQDLMRYGLLERDAAGRFTVGSRMRQIAAAAPQVGHLTDVALPVMQDIFTMTRYDVALTVIQDGQGLLVERLYGRTGLRLNYQSGELMPLHATGGGLALLAFASEELQESVLGGPLESFTSQTETDPVRLRALLEQVRRQGYVVSDRGSNALTTAIGAPVFGPSGLTAALSVIVHHGVEHPRALIDTARVGAHTLSRQLGGKYPNQFRRVPNAAPGMRSDPTTR
ncbi:IclR family transcriptional regulator [Kocuria marina]|uniref:IclR family transcriptional regulator n=1 Tax=Kocuria marina TaxID=223184 RepID=UPI003F1F4EE7